MQKMINVRAKRIAFLSPDLSFGGVEKVFIDYANSISQEYEVSFILLNKVGVLLKMLSPRIKVEVLNESRLRYALISLIKLLNCKNYDYIIAGTEKTNILLCVANIMAKSNSKIIASQHNFYDVENSYFIHNFILPFCLRKADSIFAVSKGIREMIYKMGVKNKPIEVLYNPIDIQKIRKQADSTVLDLPLKYILFVGRLTRVKNIPYLFKAFSLFVRKHPDFKLVIVGDGILKEYLYKYSSELHLSDKIVWVGATDNPYPYIKKATLVALTSFSESLSNVVLETICLGKTIVATPCIGPCEILKGSTYGYIVQSYDNVQELSSMMEHALIEPKNPQILEEYSLQFDINVSVSKLKKILS